MNDPAAVLISFEQECLQFTLGCPACTDPPACAALALERAHHRCFGCMATDPASIVTECIGTLDALSRRATSLTRRLDWRARLEVITQARKANGGRQPAAEMADLQYAQIGGHFDVLDARGKVDKLEDFLPPAPGPIEVSIARDNARAVLLQRFAGRIEAVDWHYIRTRTDNGACWEVLLDDPLDSDGILRIAETEPNVNQCLDRLASKGFAKRVEGAGAPVASQTLSNPREELRNV